MRTAVIANFKGGVGKTTTAVNTAVGLARGGATVLLLDNDAQASATTCLGVDGSATSGMYGLIVEGLPIRELTVSVEANLAVVPASGALAPVDQWLAMQTRREEVFRRRLSAVNGYDYVLLDTAPSFSLLNLNALVYASELWLPVSMEYLALEGVKQVISSLQMIEDEIGHSLPIRYVIPTFYDRRNSKTDAVFNALHSSFGDAVTNPIHINVRVSEAPSYHQSIYDYAPDSVGAHDFARLVRRIASDA